MPEQENTVTPVEAITPVIAPTPEHIPADPPKTRKKPGPRPGFKKAKKPVNSNTMRTISELDAVDGKKMTPAEADLYINHCRGIIRQQKMQLDNLDETCKKVFDDARTSRENLNKLQNDVNKDMQIIRTAATLFAESIINHTYGGK